MSRFDLPNGCELMQYVDRERDGVLILKGILLEEAATICKNCTMDECIPSISKGPWLNDEVKLNV